MRARAVLLGAVLSLIATTANSAQPSPSDVAALRAYVETLPNYASAADDRFQVGWVDLNGDGRLDALVRWAGQKYCGTGGCGMSILERTKRGFRLRGYTTLTELPIGVLATARYGWRDVAVSVRGYGNEPEHVVRLSFDGRRYPWVSNGKHFAGRSVGQAVIDRTTPMEGGR